MIEVTAQDLGDRDAPVLLAAGGGTSSVEEIRAGLGTGRRDRARCSAEMGACKWAELHRNRLVLSLSAPFGFGAEALETLAQGFDREAAEEALRR